LVRSPVLVEVLGVGKKFAVVGKIPLVLAIARSGDVKPPGLVGCQRSEGASAVTIASPCLYKRAKTIHIQEGLGASAGTIASLCLYKRV